MYVYIQVIYIYIHYVQTYIPLENDLHIVIQKLGLNKSINSVEVLQNSLKKYIYI